MRLCGKGESYLHSDRQLMDGLKTLIGELEQQATFANPSVANDDVFEEVRITHRYGIVLVRKLHLRQYNIFPSTWPFVSPTSLRLKEVR